MESDDDNKIARLNLIPNKKKRKEDDFFDASYMIKVDNLTKLIQV